MKGQLMTKHLKTRVPSDADLEGNPMIGASRGVTMSQVTPDDLEASLGASTIEGDVGNDSNPEGGVDKSAERGRISRGHRMQRTQRSRRPALQGGQTHAQQIRMLERKPDIPDARHGGAVRRVRRKKRGSR